MQIQHPSACLIARASTAQDQITGDGTTSVVLLIGELLRQAERYLAEGLHPRVLTDGFLLAKDRCTKFLESFKVQKSIDHDLLSSVARTALRTKVHTQLADHLTPIVVDSVSTIKREGVPLDLFMIEIMAIQHSDNTSSRLVKGIVLDHGARHPDMPKNLKNSYILTCNVSLEQEKPIGDVVEQYKTAAQREEFVNQERKFVDDRVARIIDLKRKVCGDDPEKSFIVVNQKGMDPGSLDMLAAEGILGLRRAKRRNMERITLACGGTAVNSVEDLTPDVLGFAKVVYEHSVGEEKYTFIEGVENPFSVTILLKAPNKHSILQMKDAIRDGIRAVKNTIDDGCLIPGAGAFEVAAHLDLKEFAEGIKGRTKFGIQAFADALLVIPKTLATNSGFDVIDTLIKLQDEAKEGHVVGLDIQSGDPFDPISEGVYDNYIVKKHFIEASTLIASQLLQVDEVMKAASEKQVKGDN
eukprot:TRINITY_DN436_c0_g1_i2.p1 TRINITY_DN436_c0_g1~~TRINITY_DN436_c0_g1_i2.p1  ORF type:complete len:469 (-),score=101.79 TRINITY_DN436_c0_g1_i2:175-1581(-)